MRASTVWIWALFLLLTFAAIKLFGDRSELLRMVQADSRVIGECLNVAYEASAQRDALRSRNQELEAIHPTEATQVMAAEVERAKRQAEDAVAEGKAALDQAATHTRRASEIEGLSQSLACQVIASCVLARAEQIDEKAIPWCQDIQGDSVPGVCAPVLAKASAPAPKK